MNTQEIEESAKRSIQCCSVWEKLSDDQKNEPCSHMLDSSDEMELIGVLSFGAGCDKFQDVVETNHNGDDS